LPLSPQSLTSTRTTITSVPHPQDAHGDGHGHDHAELDAMPTLHPDDYKGYGTV
jgi:hypothetical protein